VKEKVDQEELLRIFPGKLRKRIEEKVSFEEVTEIRLRTGLPISIVTAEESYFLQKQEGCGEREKEEEKQEILYGENAGGCLWTGIFFLFR